MDLFKEEIKHISDQVCSYSHEIAQTVSDISERYSLSTDQAIKVVGLGIENTKNDILWQRLKQLITVNADIADSFGDISENASDIAEALKKLQKIYGLKSKGELNNERFTKLRPNTRIYRK